MFQNHSCGICEATTGKLDNRKERIFGGPSLLGELII
jgi:hypothetical protein